jgi:hypothetical protein
MMITMAMANNKIERTMEQEDNLMVQLAQIYHLNG